MALSERKYLYKYRCLRCERPVTPGRELCMFCQRLIAEAAAAKEMEGKTAISEMPTIPLVELHPDPLERLRLMRVREAVRAGRYTDWPKQDDGGKPTDAQEGASDNGER